MSVEIINNPRTPLNAKVDLTMLQEFRMLHARMARKHPKMARYTSNELMQELLLNMLAGMTQSKWQDQALIIAHKGEDLSAILLGDTVYVMDDNANLYVLTGDAPEMKVSTCAFVRGATHQLLKSSNALAQLGSSGLSLL